MTLSGTITLKGGEEIEVTDATLVGNSLSGTMSVCSPGSFDVGSFNAASIQLKIYDDEALEHEFDGAEIALSIVETKEEETINTKTFNIVKINTILNMIDFILLKSSFLYNCEIDNRYG